MSRIPTPEEAYEIIKEYNKEPFHLEHARTVSKVMGELAKKYDPNRADFWRTVGMLHDTGTWHRWHVLPHNSGTRHRYSKLSPQYQASRSLQSSWIVIFRFFVG